MKSNIPKIPPDPIHFNVRKLIKTFDQYTDECNVEGVVKLIEEAKDLENHNELNHISLAALYYSIATAYSDLEHLDNTYQVETNKEKQLFYYRLSIDKIEKQALADDLIPYITGLKLNLFTNYAIALESTGRVIEAIRYFKLALAINPKFAMGLGNIGIAYLFYARIVPDPSHADILNHFGYHYLKTSLTKSTQLTEQAVGYFKYYIDQFSEDYIQQFLEPELDIKEYSLGNKKEVKFREWVLDQHLFLNPMSDLPIIESFIAGDVFGLPTMTFKVSEGINYKYHGMYDNLKQEFITARFLYYDAIHFQNAPHYADKNTYLVDTLDFTSYSIQIEKIKLSFRSSYSLFDKISFFINEYFDLGINEYDINYRSIWFSEKKHKDPQKAYKYKNILNPANNIALNAIKWILKDLYVKFYKSPSPFAKKLNNLRNALEHKYVKTYSNIFLEQPRNEFDDLAIYISEKELYDVTLDLLHMTRELLIYLSLVIHITELQKKEHSIDKFIPQISTFIYDDESKI